MISLQQKFKPLFICNNIELLEVYIHRSVLHHDHNNSCSHNSELQNSVICMTSSTIN